jgi:hypothetical protein
LTIANRGTHSAIAHWGIGAILIGALGHWRIGALVQLNATVQQSTNRSMNRQSSIVNHQ